MTDKKIERRNQEVTSFSIDETNNLDAIAKLTKRELQCLLMAVNDNTMKETAKELFISVETVRKHRSRVLEKTRCRTLIGAYGKVVNKVY